MKSGGRKIIVCAKCDGQGVIHKSELTNYHKGEYDDWTEACPTCKGSGRMLEITRIETLPYEPNPPRGRYE